MGVTLSRFWSGRHPSRVLRSPIGAIAWHFGNTAAISLVLGLVLALSSTAVVICASVCTVRCGIEASDAARNFPITCSFVRHHHDLALVEAIRGERSSSGKHLPCNATPLSIQPGTALAPSALPFRQFTRLAGKHWQHGHLQLSLRKKLLQRTHGMDGELSLLYIGNVNLDDKRNYFEKASSHFVTF